jgi:hypothetical protein
VAIASNIAFIAYGALAEVTPVLLLHVVLLPVNVLRLAESVRSALRPRVAAVNCASGRRACTVPPPTVDTEPGVASPLLSRTPPSTRSAKRSTKAVTLQ